MMMRYGVVMMMLTTSLCQDSTVDEETQKQYSPHFWSKKYSPDEALSKFLHTIAEACNRTRETVPYEGNVRYGTGERQTVDIYGAQTLPKDSDIMLYLHGGYWQVQELTKNISCQPVHPLWKRGVRVFIAGYDLAPQVTLGDIIREVRELAAFVMEYAAKNNVRKVWIVGHSVGSHLAASLLYHKWQPEGTAHILSGLFLITGIYDLTPLPRTTYNQPLGLNQETARKWSPMFADKIEMDLYPDFQVVVVTGENESPEFIKQSQNYQKVLEKQGVKSEFHLVPNLDHFDIASNLQFEDFILTKNITQLFVKSFCSSPHDESCSTINDA